MKHFILAWRPWLLLALVLACVGALLGHNIQSEYDRIQSTERQRLTTQSKVVEDNLTRQLAAINLALESIVQDMPYWASQSDFQQRANRRLKSMEYAMPAVRTFLVMDAKGLVKFSNREELIGRNFYSRDYFQTALRSANLKTLYVSAPFKSALDTFIINLVRVVPGPRGEFDGIVSASVDPVDVEILLNSVRYADDMRAMLVHGNGKIFVSEPTLEGLIGKDLSAPESFFTQHMQSQRVLSTFEGTVYSTGDRRLPVLRTIHPPELAMDKPLVVAVSRHWDSLYEEWWRNLERRLISFVGLVVLSTGLLYTYLKSGERQKMHARRLKQATIATGVGVWEYDLKSRSYHWDAIMYQLFGVDPTKANARNDDWHALLSAPDFERIKAASTALLKDGVPFDLTFPIHRPDGQMRYIRNRAAVFLSNDGVYKGLVGTSEDVTLRKQQEAELRIAAIAFDSQEAIVVTDVDLKILRVNAAFTELFGYSAQESIGQTPRLLKSGRHEKAFYEAMWGEIMRTGAWRGEVWNRRKNGDIFPEWLTVSAVRDDEGLITHYVGTHTDITLRKRAEEEIRFLAFFDPLTRLPNRRLLHDRLQQALKLANRGTLRLAIMYLDLDKFKPVNDVHGHPAGDELLCLVAQRMQSCVRDSDTVARIGGDEFLVLLPTIASAHDALEVAAKIHSALRHPFSLRGGEIVEISSSAGIAIYPDHGGDSPALEASADAALYRAKANGRDQYQLCDPVVDV